jgi:hypothetical protein
MKNHRSVNTEFGSKAHVSRTALLLVGSLGLFGTGTLVQESLAGGNSKNNTVSIFAADGTTTPSFFCGGSQVMAKAEFAGNSFHLEWFDGSQNKQHQSPSYTTSPVSETFQPTTGGTWAVVLVQENPVRVLQTVTFEVDNEAPAAANLSASAGHYAPVAINLTATDNCPSTLSYSVVSNPSHGSLGNVDSTGKVTYTPNGSFSGVDSFTFQAKDGAQNAATATVAINVAENHAPTIAAISPQTVAIGANLAFIVPAADADAGDSLTYSIVDSSNLGVAINSATGVITWSPQSAAIGYVMVHVTDRSGASCETGFSLSTKAATSLSVNHYPVLTVPAGTQYVNLGEALTLNVSATDIDDGQNLAYSVRFVSLNGVALDPSSLGMNVQKVDNNNATFTWTPQAPAVVPGTYKVKIGVCDDAPRPYGAEKILYIVVQ